jgi:hypothetical protein
MKCAKLNMRHIVFFLSALCLLCGESTLRADPPVAMYLFPAGGQQGTKVKFHAGGLYLNQSCSLEMIGPCVKASPVVRRTDSLWFEGPILPLPESQRQEDYPRAMTGTVEIAKDSPPGDRHVLLRTAQGVAAPLKFVIGRLPEIVEDELPGEAVPVAVIAPITINGRVFPREDIDVWGVTLKKGQILSAAVDADRIGSPLEAKLMVFDSAGKRIAEADASPGKDPRVQITAAEDGVFQVRITDARADGGPAFVYRLTLTNESLAEPSSAKAGGRIVREADIPDPVRGNFLAVPSIGEGRISAAAEVDRWGFSARKGDAIELELQASRLSSPLLGVLSITDSAGKELARAEPGAAPAGVDPSLKFSAPADGLYFVQVQDRFRSRGGPAFAYRLNVSRPTPGFELSFTTLSTTVVRGQQSPLKITAKRHGSFAGPIALSVEGLPPGVSIPKDVIIAAGQPSVDIALKAEASAKVDGSLIRVGGTAMISLAPFSSMFVPTTQAATWAEDSTVDQVRLAVAVATPFKIAGDYEMKLIPRGTVHSRKYRIERNGFTGPIEIDLADKQARHLQGVTGPKFVVPDDKSEFEYPITMPSWMETGRTCRVCVMGTATLKDPDGTEHVITYSSREQNDQIIAVVEPERLGLRIDRPTVLAEPGKTAEIQISLLRGEGLVGAATVDVVIPRGMKGISVQPIQIAKDQASGILKLHFGPDARGPFTMPLTLRATLLDGDKPVTAEKSLELIAPR